MRKWWEHFFVSLEDEEAIHASVHASAGLTGAYVILLVLSTVIATFGLVANSGATVIGAMIVAPLMGPILGIGLSYAQGDAAMLQRALMAEFVGITLCLLVSLGLGLLIGIDNIDFSQSEILARTRPTLLDLAVGLAAGLAGAYATVNRKVSASIAGVAIAVALVPPLCTCGLCAAGSLRGLPLWSPSLGALMLFLANFLTIQLAAIIVFALAGLGHWSHPFSEVRLRQAMLLNGILLILTSYFLWNQFQSLVTERRARQFTRTVLLAELGKIPGAHLDSLRVHLGDGRAQVDALTRAPREMPATFAAQTQSILIKQLKMPVDLEVGTVLSSYVNASGNLYRVDDALLRQTEKSLKSALEQFSGADMEFFRTTEVSDGEQALFVSIRSPYVFDAELVAKLSKTAQSQLERITGRSWLLRLTVRTTLSQVYTESGLVANDFERIPSLQEVSQARVESMARERLNQLLQAQTGGWVESVQVEAVPTDKAGHFHYRIRCQIDVPTPISQNSVNSLMKEIGVEVGDDQLELVVRSHIGHEYRGTYPTADSTAVSTAVAVSHAGVKPRHR